MSKKIPYDDLQFKLKSGKKFDPTLPVELQFDKKALRKLYSAIRFTKVMYPDNVKDRMED